MTRDVPSQDAPSYTRPPDEAYASDSNSKYVQHQLVNHAIANELSERVTGRGEQYDTLKGVRPRNQFFAAALPSQYDYRKAKEEEESFGNIGKKVAPFSVGVTFRLPTELSGDETVEIDPHAFLFQRRFPRIEEQRTHANDNEYASVLDEDDVPVSELGEDTNDEGASELEEGEIRNETDETQTDSEVGDGEELLDLLQVYERIDPEWEPVSLTGERITEILEQDVPAQIPLDFSTAHAKASDVDRRYRERSSGVNENEANMITPTVVGDEEQFEEHIQSSFGGEVLSPLWQARLEVDARVDSESEFILVTARLVNTHGEDYEDDEQYQEENAVGVENWRAALFDVSVNVTVDGVELRTFESNEIEDEYQYDGTIYGVGENAAVEPIWQNGEESEKDQEDAPVGVRTELVPTYEQARYLSRNPDEIVAPMDILAGFEGDDELFSCLEQIASAMESAVEDYRAVKDEMTAGKSDDAKEEFDDAVEDFEAEGKRFRAGIECLRQDERALRAFKLLNESFVEMGFEKWRTFQIIFIVMNVPDMLKQAAAVDDDVKIDWDDPKIEEALETAEVIYFPTGGGKTEAYLGLVTFTAFHDRLRGKTHGMTAFTKFPLRFLSLQQLQRIANVLAQAEKIRRREELGGKSFSVGYLVGSGNTPNTLRPSKHKNNIREAQTNEEFKQSVLYVQTCPYCGTDSVEIDGDLVRGRIIHKCTNSGCEEVKRQGGESAELPVYVTDREIYRYAPTFVVSTIDKISIVGMQRRMRASLFGRTNLECAKHGFSGEKRCIADTSALNEEGQCDEEDWSQIEPVEPPSLLIQDELHLLREEFGAFDSHYESLIQELNEQFTEGKWETKVVAATATIKGADRQVRALYMRDTNVFPGPGPRLNQSFYAYAHPTRVQRRMLGALPRSVSRTYAIEKVHEEYARLIQEFRNEPEDLFAAIQGGDGEYEVDDANFSDASDERCDELLSILDDYETQVSYHYSKDNTDLLKRVLRTMINVHLTDDGDPYYPLNGELMTGETALSTVRSVLETLENVQEIDDPREYVHMLIATSMISHGVDIDELGFIAFFGLPRNTAEYIQSYSRVGRKWPGTVFMLFDPMRTRDRSYYRHFQHHQEYQDLLVEATPLERWAEYAIQCTMPGVFCAILLQYYDEKLEGKTSRRLYDGEGFQSAVQSGYFDYAEMLEFVRGAYGLDDVNPESGTDEDPRTGVKLYERQIRAEFDKIWKAMLDPENLIDRRRANDPNTDESNYVSDVLTRGGQRRPMRNLRDIDDQLDIVLDPDTASIINSYRG